MPLLCHTYTDNTYHWQAPYQVHLIVASFEMIRVKENSVDELFSLPPSELKKREKGIEKSQYRRERLPASRYENRSSLFFRHCL